MKRTHLILVVVAVSLFLLFVTTILPPMLNGGTIANWAGTLSIWLLFLGFALAINEGVTYFLKGKK